MDPIRRHYSFVAPAPDRCFLDPIKIYSYRNGKLICTGRECNPKLDPIAHQVRETIELITIFCQEQFNLCGLDGTGHLPVIQIDWDEKNAAWMCHAQDGCSTCEQKCGWIFHNQFAVLPEVVAHEFMHGIIHSLTPLNSGHPPDCRRNEAGALDESIADVFACSFMHWLKQNDWRIGGVGRDLAKHSDYSDFKEARECSNRTDFGYVHRNSSIPSHAFFAAVSLRGEDHLLKITKIWLQALLQIRKSSETFADFALKTVNIAWQQNGLRMENVLKEAWVHIGVLEYTEPKPYEEELVARLWDAHIGNDEYLLDSPY